MPTLKEQGVDVALTNWRGVMAPPRIRDADKKALVGDGRRHGQERCLAGDAEERGWIDLYQPEEEFTAFLKEDQAKVEGILKEIGLVQ